MKTTDNKLINNPQLAKLLSNEMSPDDQKQFAGSDDFTQSETGFAELRQNWDALKAEKPIPTPNTQAAWQKLNNRFREEGLSISKAESKRRFSVSPTLRIAASVLLLAGVAVVVWLIAARTHPTLLSLETGNEQETRIKTLEDGSVVYLGGQSKLEYPENFGSKGRNVKLAGKAFFDVAHDAVRPFVIEAQGVQIKVLGTAFTVQDFNGNQPQVIVNRGKVEVSMLNHPENKTILVAGEKTVLMNQKFINTKVIDKQADSWFQKRMHFKDETLVNIVKVLNFNFNTNFEVTGNSVASKRLTLTFEGQTNDEMKEIICAYLNLSSKVINGKVLLMEKNQSK
jgi:ferric-dicitrate binding protein FerR (iron transport regulator)